MSTNEQVTPSTSLGTSEHDLEYGPTPPGAKYEHTDIDTYSNSDEHCHEHAD